MAEVKYVPGAEEPVNDGERRVIKYLERQLPGDFALYPGVQVIHRTHVDDIDVLVLTKHAVVLVEIKDIAGHIAIDNGACYVNDNQRPQPFNVTNSKARRLKARLQEADPRLGRVRVEALVVLAREPKSLTIRPESLKDKILVLEDAATKLVDPERVSNRPPPHDELGELTASIERILNLQQGRMQNVSFGAYRCTELLMRTPDEDLWAAEHTLTGEPVEIRHVGRNPMTRARNVADAENEYRAIEQMKSESRVVGPIDIDPQDDGTVALIYSPRQGQTLLEAIDTGEEVHADSVILDVAGALEAAHDQGVIHGRLAPRWIELLPEQVRARGFGLAQQAIAPTTQLLDEDNEFLAPEVLGGQSADRASDLFALGRLIAQLKPDDSLMQALARELTVPNPVDRRLPVGYVRDALALAFGVTGKDGATNDNIRFDGFDRIASESRVGSYSIDRHIGSGGFSDVYLARHILTQKLRAIKVFKGERAADMVKHELEVLQDLKHPNVVSVFDGADSEAGWFMVSEYLEGETLGQRIDAYDQQPVDFDEVVLIGNDLLNALSTIHIADIFHRDVKPENVILVEDRGAVLFDFGVAAAGETTFVGLTMPYWPPGVPAGASSADADLFAVGVVLCELFTGRHPYPGRNPHAGDEPDLSGIPGEVRDVLERAVSPRAEERFISATDFRDALPSIQREHKISVSPWDRYRRVQQLIAEGSLDEAEELRLPEWARLADLIARKRGVETEVQSVTAGLRVRFDREETGSFYKTDNTGPFPARAFVYHVTGKPGLMLDVVIVEHEDGESLITTSDAYDSRGRLPELVKRRRIGLFRENDKWRMRLRLTTRPQGKFVGTKQPSSVQQLSDDAGFDVEQILLDKGATAVGKRIDLGYTEPKNTKNEVDVVMTDDKRNELALWGYLLTTVMPLARDADLLLEDQS